MKKTIFFLILAMFLIVPTVFAPASITNINSGTGLQLKYPLYDNIAVKKDFDFNVHVYNTSNGVPLDNTSVSCNLHVYNQTGDHLWGGPMFHDLPAEHGTVNEWVVRLMGKNFSTVGEYTFLAQCNTSSLGGFAEENIYVSSNGLTSNSNDNTAGFSITIFILLITIGLYYAGFASFRWGKSEFLDLLLHRCTLVLAIYMTVLDTVMIATIASTSNLPLTNELFRLMWFFGEAGYIMLLYLIVKTLFDLIKVYNNEKINKVHSREEEE